jgi:hypothetical protein
MKHTRLALLLALLCFVIFTPKADALTVSPVRVEVSGNPGQTLRGEMQLLNEQGEAKTFFSSYENFEPSDDTGAPHFIGSTGNLSTWLKTSDRIDIKAGESIVVPYTITIPADAEPGGYFSAIFWGSQDPATQQGGEVAIGGKLGVLVLLRVNGDIHEEAGLTEFGATSGGTFFTALPVEFTYRFTNKGQDRVVPLGDVTIKNLLGMEVEKMAANPAEGNVLPNSTRKFQVVWGKDVPKDVAGYVNNVKAQFADFHLGLYSANIEVLWGSENKVESSKVWVVLFPWQAMTVIVGGLLILFFLIKLYNHWIISRNRRTT